MTICSSLRTTLLALGLLACTAASAAPTYVLQLPYPGLKPGSAAGNAPATPATPAPPATTPQVALTANTSSDFGTVNTGQSVQRSFTFRNTGTGPATGVHADVSGSELGLVSNTCGTTAQPVEIAATNGSCIVTLQWSPSVAGSLAGTLSITSNAATSPSKLDLVGTAVLADPYYANVGLLMHFDSNGSNAFVDNSPSPAAPGAAVGSAGLTTSQYRFGNASLATGTNSYVAMPWKPSYTLSGSYTVEAWVKLSSAPALDPGGGNCGTILAAGDASSGWQLYLCTNNSTLMLGRMGDANAQLVVNYAMPLQQWTHIAVVRDGNANNIYVNGISQPIRQNGFSGLSVPGGALTIGSERRYSGWNHDFPGYIDEVRITNGVARYKGNFAAPGAAFPNR